MRKIIERDANPEGPEDSHESRAWELKSPMLRTHFLGSETLALLCFAPLCTPIICISQLELEAAGEGEVKALDSRCSKTLAATLTSYQQQQP